METTKEFSSSFWGSRASDVFHILQKFQNLIGLALWLLLIKPLRIVFRNRNEKKTRPFDYTYDSKRAIHRVVWLVFSNLLRVSAWVNGIYSGRKMYEHLLQANSKIPMIGFIDSDRAKFTIEYLGKENEDKSRGWDLLFFSSPIPIGRFLILNRELRGKASSAIVRCVWLTGAHVGKPFDIIDDHLGKHFRNELSKHSPTHIYVSPFVITLVWELLIASGAILSILALLGKTHLFSFFTLKAWLTKVFPW